MSLDAHHFPGGGQDGRCSNLSICQFFVRTYFFLLLSSAQAQTRGPGQQSVCLSAKPHPQAWLTAPWDYSSSFEAICTRQPSPAHQSPGCNGSQPGQASPLLTEFGCGVTWCPRVFWLPSWSFSLLRAGASLLMKQGQCCRYLTESHCLAFT